MADGVEFSLIGLEDLLGKLRSVSHDVRRKGGRAALRKAAGVVVARAKEGAQGLDDSQTGRSIADNVAARWNGRLFRRTGDLGFRVGVLQGAVLPDAGEKPDKGTNAPTPHWRLLEFGTEKMRAQPFMRKALADHISEVIGVFVTEYDKALDRAIRRAAKASRGA